MKIFVSNKQKDLRLSVRSVKALVNEVLRGQGSIGEVGVHFVGIKKISDLHDRFFGDPAPTDCISLPIDGPEVLENRVLGDVFVCPQIAVDYALSHGKEPYDEVSLYIVHGLLHLLGYDDIEKSDRALMRAAERAHMKNLNAKNLCLQSGRVI